MFNLNVPLMNTSDKIKKQSHDDRFNYYLLFFFSLSAETINKQIAQIIKIKVCIYYYF